MILRMPSNSCKAHHSGDKFVPAWQAVDRIQRRPTEGYWLVTQPDHAHLSGRIAAAFDRQRFPWLTPALIECIGMHDDGWRRFDGEIPHPVPPRFDANGKPLTFVELLPEMSVAAWTASVANAVNLDALGGAVVSRHFLWLAHYRLEMGKDTPEDRDRLTRFVASEKNRQAEFASNDAATHLDEALDVLQFCDLLSLYLCSGATDNVEFPQGFGGQPVRLTCEDGRVTLSPSPFAAPTILQCPAFVPNRDGSFTARTIVCEIV